MEEVKECRWISLSGSEVDSPEDTSGLNNSLNITRSVSAPKKKLKLKTQLRVVSKHNTLSPLFFPIQFHQCYPPFGAALDEAFGFIRSIKHLEMIWDVRAKQISGGRSHDRPTSGVTMEDVTVNHGCDNHQ